MKIPDPQPYFTVTCSLHNFTGASDRLKIDRFLDLEKNTAEVF
jgi:hypothetical protein